MKLQDEKAAIIPIVLFAFLAVLAVAGVAVDFGNLVTTRLHCQRAADAAALAGMRYRSQIGYEGPTGARTNPTWIEQHADQVLRLNLKKRNLSDNAADVTLSVDYDHVTDRIKVNINYHRDLYIMGMIPFIGVEQSDVPVESQAGFGRSITALLLDLSGSMNCPADVDCGCLKSETDPDAAGSSCPNQKIEHLKNAVSDFIRNFSPEPGKDQLALVPFAARAKVLVGFPGRGGTGPYNWDPIMNAINNDFNLGDPDDPKADRIGIGEGANTNLSDALIETYNHVLDRMQSAVPADDRIFPGFDLNYVIFSDGAPTAGRFFYASQKTGVNGLDPSPGPANFTPAARYQYDYTHWDITWVHPDPKTIPFSGPSSLVQTGRVLVQRAIDPRPFVWEYTVSGDYYNGHYAPQWSGRPAGSVAVADDNCTDNDYPTKEPKVSNISDNERVVFHGCLNDLRFYVPGSPRIFGPNTAAAPTPPWSGSYAPYFHWRQNYYNVSIAAADSLRDLAKNTVTRKGGGTIYIAAIGNPARIEPGGLTDPYEFCPNCTSTAETCLFCADVDKGELVSRDVDGNVISPAKTRLQLCSEWISTNGGDNCPYSTAVGDISQSLARKDLFLARVAADRNRWATRRGAASGLDFAFAGYSGGTAYMNVLNTTDERRLGRLLTSNSYSDLDEFFKNSASDILMRLLPTGKE